MIVHVVYLQHNIHCLINKTVNEVNFSLLIICLSNGTLLFYLEQNISVKFGKISYNGGLYMAMITCGMIITRETDQLLLTIPN